MSDTESHEGNQDNEDTESQCDLTPLEDSEKVYPYIVLQDRKSGNKIQVPFKLDMPPQISGRDSNACDVVLGGDKQISRIHFLFICLGSGFRILDVSGNGATLIRNGKST